MKYGLPVFSPLGRREDIMRSRPVGDPVIEEINFALDQLEATGPISTSPISTGPPEAAGAQSGPAGELEMVLIVHRHGARFPTKKLKGDLSWPASAQFWEDFAAQLTPTGALQLAQLGRWLAKRYAGLFAGVASEEVNEVVKVHTSNYQRTLFSAWSLLNGMFPQVPRYFNYLSERQGVDMTALDASMEAQGVNLGIAINIESNDEDDYLFHQIKAETTPEWVRDFEDGDNVNKDPEFHRMSQDPAYIALCQKLYKITGKKKLNHPKKRMTKLKSIFTQIEIARTHNLPILPNKDCEMVTPHELEMIEQAARSYIKHMFRPADSNKISDGIGEHSAGYLGNEIARVIEERIDGKHSLKFIEYSCHDSTCLALASLLGLDIEPPGFTGPCCPPAPTD